MTMTNSTEQENFCECCKTPCIGRLCPLCKEYIELDGGDAEELKHLRHLISATGLDQDWPSAFVRIKAMKEALDEKHERAEQDELFGDLTCDDVERLMLGAVIRECDLKQVHAVTARYLEYREKPQETLKLLRGEAKDD